MKYIMKYIMRMWNYEWYENVILWMIWECDIMNDMRKSNYEWYEKVELWMIWENRIMNDMGIYNYVWTMNICISYENHEQIKNVKSNI